MKKECQYLWAKASGSEIKLQLKHVIAPVKDFFVCGRCNKSVFKSTIVDETKCPLCGFAGLKCYKNDVIDWVIAESPTDATAIEMELLGEFLDGEDYSIWDEVDVNSELTVFDESETPSVSVTKTVREWITEKGRGMLCSTEF